MKIRVEADGVAIAWAHARGATIAPAAPELLAEIDAEIARKKAEVTDAAAVRDMLRFGKYKPTGRGKPASEYLLNAAKEDRFPRINNLVDALNLVSLRYALPISLIALDKVGASELLVRRGRSGESYVFNAAGQTIELEDLLLVAALPEDRALANPVKDSMASKLDAPEGAARAVLGVVYAPSAWGDRAHACAKDLAAWLARAGAASETAHGIV